MEKNYDFRERLRAVHKANRRRDAVWHRIAGTVVDDTWQIVFPDQAGRVVRNAARDLQEYFEVSMGVYVKTVPSSKRGEGKAVTLSLGLDGAPSSYRLISDGEGISILGADERGIAQGCYALEDRMNLNEGPVLELCDVVKAPLYSPRMTHSGYGLDLYPDDYLRVLAHYGMDAILVFVKDLDITAHGYLDFNDLIRRAADYGIDVYAYSRHHNTLHPDEEGAREFYASIYGTLFAKCPGLKGIVFVGESAEFPSKDPRTMMTTRYLNGYAKATPGKSYPGWFPCTDWPDWVKMVREVIREESPEADIVFWSYNWNRKPEEDRLALIRNLPVDISLQATFEMGVREAITPTVTRATADYTLSYTGPSDYFSGEAKEAARCGLKVYTMSNTGGATWDFGVIPYLPAPYRWKMRWDQMRFAHDNYNLRGLMECHHYGFYPSFIGELHKAHCWSPVEDFDKLIYRIAVRDYGEENAEKVLEAWRQVSVGMGEYVASNYDQYGGFRIGPSYPLLVGKDAQIPTVPYAFFGGNRICKTMYPVDPELKADQLSYEMEQNTKLELCLRRAGDLLEEVLPRLSEEKLPDGKRMWALVRFMEYTCRTVLHVKRWQQLKWRLGFRFAPADGKSKATAVELSEEVFSALSKEERASIIGQMQSLAEEELENARRTIPLVELDSRLGYEPSMEYIGDKEHLLWKIEKTKEALEKEILPLLQYET